MRGQWENLELSAPAPPRLVMDQMYTNGGDSEPCQWNITADQTLQAWGSHPTGKRSGLLPPPLAVSLSGTWTGRWVGRFKAVRLRPGIDHENASDDQTDDVGRIFQALDSAVAKMMSCRLAAHSVEELHGVGLLENHLLYELLESSFPQHDGTESIANEVGGTTAFSGWKLDLLAGGGTAL
eukprot:SAG31_NODE_12360_length_947_cov_1.581368_1_plen_180_part_10